MIYHLFHLRGAKVQEEDMAREAARIWGARKVHLLIGERADRTLCGRIKNVLQLENDGHEQEGPDCFFCLYKARRRQPRDPRIWFWGAFGCSWIEGPKLRSAPEKYEEERR